MQLKKRGKVWWAYITDPDGGRRKFVSTRCQSKEAAIVKAQELERRAVDPAYRAAAEETILTATKRFLTRCQNRELKQQTIDFYTDKARHLLRLFGDVALVDLDEDTCLEYVNSRTKEGASKHTIWKEISLLRSVLRSSIKAKKFIGDTSFVPSVPRGYSPRKGYLPFAKIDLLLGCMPPRRAAFCAFILGTSARFSEALAARRGDIDWAKGTHGTVKIRGTKTRESEREVPVISILKHLVERAEKAGTGETPKLLEGWTNANRDLRAACRRARLPEITFNDLRRSVSTWLVQAGVDALAVSKVMGHADATMVEQVYGVLDSLHTSDVIEAALARYQQAKQKQAQTPPKPGPPKAPAPPPASHS